MLCKWRRTVNEKVTTKLIKIETLEQDHTIFLVDKSNSINVCHLLDSIDSGDISNPSK